LFVRIENRNNIIVSGDLMKCMEEGRDGASLLRRLEDVVGNVEGVVVVDGEDPQVEVGDVEGCGRDEDFGHHQVFKGGEGGFMEGRVRKETHMLSTLILKGQVVWGIHC
jgi:hypothetical protein